MTFISSQCRTHHRPVKLVATIGGMLAVAAAASDRPDWPPFVPPRSSLSAGVVSSIERVWRAPTLTRTVEGEPAPVPLKIYDAFLDSPDVTAAAARQLKLARYQVRMMGDGWYEADDGQGARGIYRVLVRTPERHVVLSWGHHSGAILGTISGAALTVLEFEERDNQVSQKLTTYVLIDNRVAAALARALVPVFGGLVDRKLSEGFHVTARVAEWAMAKPHEFCPWLRDQHLVGGRVDELFAAGRCQAASSVTR